MSEPGWYPDPSGRHQLRWHDGTRYTDHVADGGVASSDPGPRTPTAGVVPPSDTTGRQASKLPLIVAAVAAFVVVLGVVTLLNRGDGRGTGTFQGEVTGDEPGRHGVSIPGGAVAVVTVEPASDFDAVVGFEVAGEDRRRVERLYEDTPVAFVAQEQEGLIFRRDSGFEGEQEQTLLPVPFGVGATVVVSGFEDSEGRYEVTIEIVELDVDEGADGDAVIDAVLAERDVPAGLRDDLESLFD